jgi:hypothetical protein
MKLPKPLRLKYIVLLALIVIIISCQNVLNRYKETAWKSPPYAIIVGLTDSCPSFNYVARDKDYPLISCIIEFANDSNYIILSSHNSKNALPQYWIIDRSVINSDSIIKRQSLIGPLDSTTFVSRKKQLGIDLKLIDTLFIK